MAEFALYFAYGSNMLSRRLRVSERAPSAELVGTAQLRGYRIAFDKRGQDGSGKCHVQDCAALQTSVYGVLYRIDAQDWRTLDRAEGRGEGYERIEMSVEIAGRALSCMSYQATDIQTGLKPFHWYKQLVLAGAEERGLPAEYMSALRAFESIEDADVERRRLHAAILQSARP